MKDLSTPFQAGRAAAASILFILLGAALIPFAGVQADEALFGVPLYLYKENSLCLSIYHHKIPLMVMTYVGTLKTLIYSVIFQFWHVTVWSIRLPMVLAGGLTVFLFYKFSSLAAGSFAGLAGALLLATDPTFLITNTYDWGPVALGHLLLVAGCLFLARFGQEKNSMRDLALGFFFLGLGLWNKALMFWILAGLGAGVLVFWPELRRRLSFRTVSVAAIAFLFGAAPFVIYNIRHRNATIGENARLERHPVGVVLKWKGGMLDGALNGSGLFGFITMADWQDGAKPAVTPQGKLADWIRRRTGPRQRSWFDYAFLVALLAIPWWKRSRAAWFALIVMVVTWSVMAATDGAGGAIHHSVLLWPFPQFFVAIVLSLVPWRSVAIGIAAALVAMNLAVVNEYIAELDCNGVAGNFTDALFPLSNALAENGKPVYITDWGMDNTIALLHEGRVVVRSALGVFAPETPADPDWEFIKRIMDDPDAVFVGHVPGREVNPGVNQHVDRATAKLRKKKLLIQVVSDSHGRPAFEIFRFAEGS